MARGIFNNASLIKGSERGCAPRGARVAIDQCSPTKCGSPAGAPRKRDGPSAGRCEPCPAQQLVPCWGHPWGAGGTAWGQRAVGERGAQCHPGEPRAPQQGVCLPPPARVCVWAPVLRVRAWPRAPAAARGVAVAQAPRARSLNNSAHRSASCCKCFWPRAGQGTLLPDRGTSLSPSLSSSPSSAGALHGAGEPPHTLGVLGCWNGAGHVSSVPSSAGWAAQGSRTADEVFAREAR